jgi:hypothetical protein
VDDQQRVTFRFEEDSEVQYLRDIPELGDKVSHQGALWMVSSVNNDGLGALVTCQPTHANTTSDAHARRATL